jgi:glycosyltransferase involved in cell wall biosynthesis
MHQLLKVGVVIPARNEALAITEVVSELTKLVNPDGSKVIDHIVVCDNGSTDDTALLAQAQGAIIVKQAQAGYGIACLSAIAVMPEVDVLLFVDGDRSVHAEQSLRLLAGIAEGADLVLGARNLGQIEAGAMTVIQRFGNTFALRLVALIWGFRFHDLGPFRAIRRECYRSLAMQDEAFGWTMEMQIKAVQRGLRIREVAVDTRARLGLSKISGTLSGVIGAGLGILGKVWTLWRRERHAVAKALAISSR